MMNRRPSEHEELLSIPPRYSIFKVTVNLFNDTFPTAYVTQGVEQKNDFESGELKRTWKELVMVYLKVFLNHLRGVTEENHGTHRTPGHKVEGDHPAASQGPRITVC
jgi:hypothetical protein